MPPRLPFGSRVPDVPELDDPPVSPWEPAGEPERVMAWRRAKLEERGVSYPVALELAMSHADVTAIARALDRGMTVKQVERVYL